MDKLILILITTTFSFQTMAQVERFFTKEEAISWVPQLIGYNMELIGEKNDKGIRATDTENIEFLFMTDTKEKAQELKTGLKEKAGYQLYKEYSLDGFWFVTGVTDKLSMEFGSFSKWTFEFCKTGFDYDTKLLNWNILDKENAENIDEFWNWFKNNQDEFFNLDYEKMDGIEEAFKILDKWLKPLNESITYEFSPILENGKRRFILSAEGNREAFQDLLYLFKRSPELEKWEIIPFKQGFDGDPQLEFNNGYTLSWDKVMFESKETKEGLSIDFYIEDYDKGNEDFEMGLVILLDSYLGEYDAVMQIRYADIHKLNRKKAKHLKEFKDLKQVVDKYKMKKKWLPTAR